MSTSTRKTQTPPARPVGLQGMTKDLYEQIRKIVRELTPVSA